MNQTALIWLCMAIGSTLGSFIPTLWGAGFLSLASVIFSTMGGLLGIYIGYRLNQ